MGTGEKGGTGAKSDSAKRRTRCGRGQMDPKVSAAKCLSNFENDAYHSLFRK